MNLRAPALLALALLLPAAALAQATDFVEPQLMVSGGADAQVNLAECEADQSLTVAWELDATPESGQTVRIYTDTVKECNSTAALAVVQESTAVATRQTATVMVRTHLLEGTCGSIEDHTRYICFELTGDALTDFDPWSLAIDFDTALPTDPVVSAVGGDQIIKVSWSFDGSSPSDLDGFRVSWQPVGSADASASSSELSSAVSDYTVEGLTNDTEYEVWVQTKDDFGNWSEGSASVTATPRASDDFWEHYRDGGGAQAGCASAGGARVGLAALLLLLPGLGLLRRRRLLGGLALLALVASLLPASARAAGWVEDDRGWYFELELGPYFPEIDDETAATPYADVFGTKQTLLGRLRLERAIWQGFGQVGVGLGAGFGQDVGKGLYPDGTPSPDTTVFNWVPFDLAVSYRFDYAAQEWQVPLVPYLRAGLVWDLWWILDGTGGVAVDSAGERAQGGRWGFEYELGLQVLLDALDPQLAKDFERSSGVDNSYLYFAYRRLQIDGFGSAGFDLSDTTWSLGLAIEF
ncbi:MAG: fibronectin type III domain-containing protein [Deltaproteobacteria bacterium]|nr:fibronectin type III domain-containing protein [Deltaproteobacteria bacterium]